MTKSAWDKHNSRRRMRNRGTENVDGSTPLWKLLQGPNPPARKPQQSKAQLRAIADEIARKHNLK